MKSGGFFRLLKFLYNPGCGGVKRCKIPYCVLTNTKSAKKRNFMIRKKKLLSSKLLNVLFKKEFKPDMPISILSKVSFFPVLISAVQNSPVSIIITDAEGDLLYVNPEFTRVTGYTSEEVLGKNARIRRSKQTAPEVLQSLSDAFHSGLSWSGELWNEKKSGEVYLESVVIAPIKDSAGVLTNFVGLQRDITEERQLLDKVSSSEASFRLLANSITDVYFALDNQFRITYWNKTCEGISGLSVEEVKGVYLAELITEKFGFSIGEEVFFAFKEQQEITYLREIVLHGHIYFWEISCYPTDAGVVVIAKNVTESQSLSLEIKRKNAELKLLLEQKDKFFSIIAHDLQSPFQSMLGLSSMLSEDDSSMSLAEIQDISQRLTGTIRNTFSLLQNLLEWSRLEVGKVPVALVKMQTVQVVTQAINTLELAAQQKKVEIDTRGVEPLRFTADQYMIVSVLHNLLANAIKFTPPGGKIQFIAIKNENTVELKICDNGVGMPAEAVRNIFELGSGVSTLGTSGEKGTGLGLLLCKEMMQRQNGKISVSSIPGEGTTFTLTFPA